MASMKKKRHRAMGDEVWYANSGTWPSELGNRPGTKVKTWHDLYKKIEKCPAQLRGQTSLFMGQGQQTCACGFHSAEPKSATPALKDTGVTPSGPGLTAHKATGAPLGAPPAAAPGPSGTSPFKPWKVLDKLSQPSELAVDKHNMPGMDKVDSLAEFLVDLRHEPSLTLTNQQAGRIVSLWQNLLPYDQQRVAFAARNQERLNQGRFRSPKKKKDFTAGVDGMKRCVLSASGSPAQRPDWRPFL
ncbi:hypothetical protein AALO_G00207880 [Alosa alosa]|uniref:Uncharacterized protein n=1 Tax=Alosa alosa TaxID=278164 RepID=A0AAV6G1Y1_9TELE|nr:hypothetical protein AALO_G00207880 [Alosa alosa]